MSSVKNMTFGDRRTRKIKALSRTLPGKTSDKRTADDEDYQFSARSKLWKDTSFQVNEPPRLRMYQPKKKPRRGKLTAQEKATNQAIARKRYRSNTVLALRESSILHAMCFAIDETAYGLHNLRCGYRLSAELPNQERISGARV